MSREEDMLQRVADVVAAYVANNAVPTQDVAWIVARVHEAFMGAACEATEEPQQAPAVPIPSRCGPMRSSAWRTGDPTSRFVAT